MRPFHTKHGSSSLGTAKVRPPAVAGVFYPADADRLRGQILGFVTADSPLGRVPKALVVPHAGYEYSGPIAGRGYTQLKAARKTIERVVLLGPAHYVPVAGLATASHCTFQSPLGEVPIDVNSLAGVVARLGVTVSDEAHEREHSLEVHLPFLQESLERFLLAPLLVGQASAGEVAVVLESLWGDHETLIVVSSDLSHFLDYETARKHDRRTADRIEQLQGDDLAGDDACGCLAIRGLLEVARRKGLQPTTLDLRNSGDTSGQMDRVVGYGAFAFYSV